MFYAFVSRYGNNMRSAEDNKRIGHVVVFVDKRDRDFFIAEDSQMREAVTSREARYYLTQFLAAEGYDPSELYYLTMAEVVDIYVGCVHELGGF